MRLDRPGVWIGLCSAVAVLLLAVVGSERNSPGALSAVHGRAEGLEGGARCNACHGGWFSDMTESCLECHADVAADIEARSGLHGRLERGAAQRCSSCHSEHHGPGFAVVNARSFSKAGVPDPEAFDHGLVGFDLGGAHLAIDCADCHEHARDPVLPRGARRFLGLDRDCASCHEDPHRGRFEIACAQCHGQETWTELFSLGHERRLELVGGHGDVACRTCHAEPDAHSLEALGGRGAKPPARACADCHDSPHDRRFAEGAAGRLASPTGASCLGCHAALHTSFREPGLTVDAALHAASGFPLEAPHADVACGRCHDAALAGFAERYPGRGADDCAACHEDVHGGQFAEGPFAPGGCLACHERTAFAPHAFTLADHARTALELAGSHAELACESCHEREAEDAPRAFRGTPAACDACHADAHDGYFARFAPPAPAPAHGECARCHVPTRFSEVERFDHGRWTAFAVDGAHAQGECSGCHAPRPAADAAGRAFGRVEETFGPFEGCSSCHRDVHAGGFDRPGAPASVAGREGCARCHGASSFRDLPHGFDHGRWTGYPLAGAHASIACSACHAALRRPDGEGRTWARAQGTACADCHADPHAGQFEVAGRTDCARCHEGSERFLLAFDHERDARFALGLQHRGLACSACHLPARDGAREVVRYRPLPTACADCHGEPAEVLERRRGRR